VANPDKGWFSLDLMAQAFGVTPQGFAATVRPLLPSDAIRGAGKLGVKVKCRAAIDAWVAHKLGQASPTPDDPLMAGGTSPALERYRLGRATMVEMDIAERERGLVKGEAIRAAVLAGVGAMRAAGDRLSLLAGNEAADIYNEGVAEFEAAALRALEETLGEVRNGTDSGLGGGTEDVAAPHVRAVRGRRDHSADGAVRGPKVPGRSPSRRSAVA